MRARPLPTARAPASRARWGRAGAEAFAVDPRAPPQVLVDRLRRWWHAISIGWRWGGPDATQRR